MGVNLREMTMGNFDECIILHVAKDKKSFVAPNVYSLPKAKADRVSKPLASTPATGRSGFIMHGFEPKDDRGYVSRLIVETRLQGNGYGRDAMVQVIDRLKQIPKCREIQTLYAPRDAVAGHIYEDLGFDQTDETIDGEIVVRMKLSA